MVVLQLVIVVGAAVVDVVFGAEAKPEQQASIHLAVDRGDDLDAARQCVGDRGARFGETGVVEQVALVEHHEIGAGDLILEHFLDRIVMIQRAVGGALPRQRVEIGCDTAVGERGAVDHHDHAVDGDAALDRRPLEGLHQRLRQRQAGRLDHDVLGAVARQDAVERRHEFVRHGAAQAAIGEFDDVRPRGRRRCRSL